MILTRNNLTINSHYNMESCEENYECPQCFRTYRRHGTLRRHLRQECGKGKSMVCSVCGHRTKRADHLRQHVRKKHPEMAMRSLFRRPANVSGVRTHGTLAHRLPTQQHVQVLQEPSSPPVLAYSEAHGQLRESMIQSVSMMGVDVVDLDKEDDDDNDDDKKSVDDNFGLENHKFNLPSQTNSHGGKRSECIRKTSNAYPQTLYHLHHQFQHQPPSPTANRFIQD